MTSPVFLYGTLCDPELFEIVSGVPLDARPAKLDGASVHWVKDQSYPTLTSSPGNSAGGILVEVDAAAKNRLDFYEIGFGYLEETRIASLKDGELEASIYVSSSEQPLGEHWSLSCWQKEYGTLTRLAAKEYIGLMETHTPNEAAVTFPQVRSRADSRLRARNEPSPILFSPNLSDTNLIPQKTQQPYTDYFAVREDWLNIPKFDGSSGPVTKRASFLSGDAVTVLPYDPSKDAILLVRQFRHGPFCRGDSNPWTLEPAAGRIDPGEDPEDTARRELLEETGVAADKLEFVGRYYPSPGAYSEFLYSYVAIAALDGFDGGVGGLEDEAEDIMRHVISLSDAYSMIESGAANTAPLILSLQWLLVNRDRLC